MNTKIQAVGFNADQKLMTFIETKTKKLLVVYMTKLLFLKMKAMKFK